MESRLSKESVLRDCLIKQELTIADFENEIASLRQDIFTHNPEPAEAHPSAVSRGEVLIRLENELDFLKNELATLEELDAQTTFSKVQPGAIVVTNQRTFFISVSIEELEVNGQQVFGLSVNAPIYEVLMGKKKGDSFEFNGLSYEILDVY